jgi:hypothetical protein
MGRGVELETRAGAGGGGIERRQAFLLNSPTFSLLNPVMAISSITGAVVGADTGEETYGIVSDTTLAHLRRIGQA